MRGGERGMPGKLSNQVALVTGGSRGIGRAICQALDREGARLFVHYRRDRRAAEELCRSLTNPATLLQADLASLESIEQMFRSLGGATLDVLVNNAGIWKSTPLGSTTKELLDALIDTNLKGMFWVTQCALDKMNPGGRIVNISSVAGRTGVAGGRSLYGATKAAVDSLTRNWALELASRKIRVNAVAPGYVETDMTAEHFADPEVKKNALRRHPFGRLGAPEDVAQAVLFLCSPESGFITGQSINVSGGFVV